MLFNSYVFVFAFLPISLIGYYLAVNGKKEKMAKIWLIAMSLWFYGSFHLVYLLLLLGSVVFNYAVSRRIQEKKSLLVMGIAGNLALLFYLKYVNFLIENINHVFLTNLPLAEVLVPLGISFFTFQQISFLVDSRRGEVKACGFLDYFLYISYFPKLIEGPIVTADELLPQITAIGRIKPDAEQFMRGLSLFVFGMAKKVILADTFGGAVDYGYTNLGMMHSSDALLLVIFYALQLYFDFSGYCDMARGISRLFGIEMPINFNSPYRAVNIVDFWKRWHITLNRFFTRYVYIPLGGNRRGTAKMYLNLLLVFLLSGLWHGAGWNFILWGGMHGILYVLTRMWQRRRKRGTEGRVRGAAAWISVLLTFLFVSVAWVYFRADSVTQGNQLLGLIAGSDFARVNRNLAGYFNLDEFWYVIKVFHLDAWEFGHYILMFAITVFSLLLVFWGNNAAQAAEKIKPRVWTAVLMSGLFFWCILTFSKVATFLYFNF